MLSALLLLSLISTYSGVKSEDERDLEYVRDPYAGLEPEVEGTHDYIYINESTTLGFIDEGFEGSGFPDINFDPNIKPGDNPPEQEVLGESTKKGADASFWFYLIVCILASIGLIIFGVFIVFDLSKKGSKKSEDREKYITEKHKDLDQVGMDKPSVTANASARNTGASATSTTTTGKSQLQKSSSKMSGKSGNVKSTRSPLSSSKSSVKSSQKPGPTESKPKVSGKSEPSKKTLSGA